MSRRFGVLCALGLFISGTAAAAPVNCDGVLSEAQMMTCARADFAAAEARMAVALGQSRAELGPAGAAKLDLAQTTWAAWRDAECAWNAYDPYGGGTDPLILESCRADMTLSRADELGAVLNLMP